MKPTGEACQFEVGVGIYKSGKYGGIAEIENLSPGGLEVGGGSQPGDTFVLDYEDAVAYGRFIDRDNPCRAVD